MCLGFGVGFFLWFYVSGFWNLGLRFRASNLYALGHPSWENNAEEGGGRSVSFRQYGFRQHVPIIYLMAPKLNAENVADNYVISSKYLPVG